ncbi:MAG: hypothetical protein KF708_09885 [Pirellulales bacterium]|nr:hypothetical protein [Pirellulales bacterium]
MKKSRESKQVQRPRIDVTGYAGQWLALDPESYAVAASNPSPKRASEKARAVGVEDLILLFVPTSDAFFVGAGA